MRARYWAVDGGSIARAQEGDAVDHKFSGRHEAVTRLQELQSGRGVYCSIGTPGADVCTGVASMNDKALREQVLQDLTHVVTVKVKPVWISAALSAVRREKRERRVRPKRAAIDVVRSTMIEMGIDKEEPFSVSGAIVARLQAMNDVMKNRDVSDALTKALAGGVLNVARALVSTPLHIRHADDLANTKLYFDLEGIL